MQVTGNIIFVIGPSASGKSTFIKENFPEHTVVDLLEIQNRRFRETGSYSVQTIRESYEITRDELVKAVKKGGDIVLEHTLLRAKFRSMYVDAVKEVTDTPIDVFVIKPSLQVYEERCRARIIPCEKELLDILEIPTKNEGFRNITVITDTDNETPRQL